MFCGNSRTLQFGYGFRSSLPLVFNFFFDARQIQFSELFVFVFRSFSNFLERDRFLQKYILGGRVESVFEKSGCEYAFSVIEHPAGLSQKGSEEFVKDQHRQLQMFSVLPTPLVPVAQAVSF